MMIHRLFDYFKHGFILGDCDMYLCSGERVRAAAGGGGGGVWDSANAKLDDMLLSKYTLKRGSPDRPTGAEEKQLCPAPPSYMFMLLFPSVFIF